MISRFGFALLLAATVALSLASRFAVAAQPGPDGYYRTGSGVQTANHWPITLEVFAIWHECRQLPPTKTRQAVIDLDADKRFTLRMLRDVDADKLRGGLQEGYRRNGYADEARIARFLSALTGTLPNGKALWITYDPSAKQTRLVVDGGGAATVDGVDFMKATWSIWLGKSKPSDLGDALIREL
jgi:hypothetical protein